MTRVLLHVVTVGVALAIAAAIVPGVHIASFVALAVAAVALGIVNAIVRPILFVLTLPITLLTLGLFYFVVNGIAFGLAAALGPGFSVSSWLSAIAGAFVTGVVSWLVGALVPRR
jgi:putative membrane protein